MSDGIVLMGLPGSGKTTVGKAVAERLGRPFIDIDYEIQRTTGPAPAEILALDGEPALRALERDAVSEAVKSSGAVIATGGGTVIDPLNRWLLMEHGLRVSLEAPINQLAHRLRADITTPRPLLGGDLEVGLGRTAESRASVYAASDVRVDASGDVDEAAAAVVRAADEWQQTQWRPLLDAAFERHHPIGPARGRLYIGRGLTGAPLNDALHGLGTPAVLADRAALDANPGLSTALPEDRICVIEGGEQVKTMAQLEQVLLWLAAMNLERSDPLIVVGGGSVGDLGGLAAALHRRGIPLVSVPTTWLAQADSAIGGKVAIDLPEAKNGVGAFWPASLIVEDVDLLGTLPVERRRDGIAECLKAGLIGDPLLWQLVKERGCQALEGRDSPAAYAITERAIRVKLDIVDRDPFESGERRKLNLGHTIGHALEIESGYTLAHGTAVCLGLRAEARIALARGLANVAFIEEVDSVLASLGFQERRAFDGAAVVRATLSDKKRANGMQPWLLPVAVGDVTEVGDVTDREIEFALSAIAA